VNDDELGAGFWFKIFGLILVFGLGAMALFLLVDRAWYRWGGLGTLLFFFGIVLVMAYISDKRQVKKYADLDS
jgi:hypothetical protein